MDVFSEIYNFALDHFGKLGTAVMAVGFLVWTAIQTVMSRIRPGDLSLDHFTHPALLRLPQRPLGYSNRIAYLMAELAYLAYFEFEKSSSIIPDAVKRLVAVKTDLNTERAEGFVKKLVDDSLSHGGRAELASVLEKNHLKLLETINRGPLQAFICKNIRPGQAPFLVVSFRGSEEKVNDWLTNFRAIPTVIDGKKKVHTGFFETFNEVKTELEGHIQKYAVGEDGEKLLVYFTGHSLGGAWALLATSLLVPELSGACYSFGAPRIANYEFFFSVKKPAFRIVNSADIVPRVPPGITSKILFWLFWGFAKLIPVPVVSSMFKWMARLFNRLEEYRHFGDQRYLTDVRNGRFEDTQLLQNPHLADRLLWFWKSILAGITFPIKSHSMTIYRDKLAVIASKKNP